MSNIVALNHYLSYFADYFALPAVTEICINRPGEIWIEQQGQFRLVKDEKLTPDFLYQFAALTAEANDRAITRTHPILSAKLPNDLRVQFVIEPACARGSFICSIRQKGVQQAALADFFHEDQEAVVASSALMDAYRRCDQQKFLQLAIALKKNIVIAGGTSTGKTTLLNTLVKMIPLTERIITIETDREVSSPHENTVHLLAADEGTSVAKVTMLDLLKASLRLRPDRILVSELRAEEAYPYLRAINSGHPGSITTMHADSPRRCFEQLAFMVMQGGSSLRRAEIIEYAQSIINVIVQIKRRADGRRSIVEIYFDEAVHERINLTGS